MPSRRRAHDLRAVKASRLIALGEMVAGVAHELRQPLTGISATAESLLVKIKRGGELSEDRTERNADLILAQLIA